MINYFIIYTFALQEGLLVSFSEVDAESLQINLQNITVDNLQNDKMVRIIIL